MMISKNQIKLFSSLRNKKYREMNHKFLAEGEKTVSDILRDDSRLFKIHCLIATPGYLKDMPLQYSRDIPEVLDASPSLLEKISSLSTPNKAILVCEIPEYMPDYASISEGLSLFLDDIRDPGNLGTIMRSADWFGIRHIFCTTESVDVYNPKVVQSTMGALCRVKVYYVETESFIREIRKIKSTPLAGTILGGANIYTSALPEKAVIVLGNESRGISAKILDELDLSLSIPSQAGGQESSESLNVASAAAIVMGEFRRRQYYSK